FGSSESREVSSILYSATVTNTYPTTSSMTKS
ncbi:hypothetical protein CCACVL1_00161, partial [Corchorus capsularis]